MKSLEQQFADWVSKQPADGKYDFVDPEACALCLFLGETGMAAKPCVGGDYWREESEGFRNLHPLSDRMSFALSGFPWTFGALAERLASPAVDAALTPKMEAA